MGRCKPLLLLSRFCRVRLCDPVDSSPPGSSARGILQARILEWAAMSFSIHGFHMHLSYLGPVLFPHSPCSLHCSISTAITMRRDSILWIAVLGALIPIWGPDILISQSFPMVISSTWETFHDLFFFFLVPQRWEAHPRSGEPPL